MSIPKQLKAQFKIEFEKVEDAQVVLKTIEVELKTAPSERSSVNANLEGNVLYLNINAEDTPSLRANLNSYLRWIILSLEVQKLNVH